MKSKNTKYQEAVARNIRFAGLYIAEIMRNMNRDYISFPSQMNDILVDIKQKIGIRRTDDSFDKQLRALIPFNAH